MSLSKQFSDLASFVEKWDLPDYNARYAMRLSSSMEELKEFFSAMLGRAEDIKAYLDGIDFSQYSEADKRLARLMFALGVVGPAVEIYRRQRVPDSGAASFDMVIDPELN